MKRKFSIFLFLISYLISRICIHAAFKDGGQGTRPTGMGGAFVSVADDHNAPSWNPAGIAQMETRELAMTYGRPFLGLDLKSGESDTTFLQTGNISAVTPFPTLGALGFSWSNFLVSKLYQEDAFLMNYANSLHDKIIPGNDSVEFYAGFNLKFLRRSFSVDSETLEREKDAAGKLAATSPLNEPDSKNALAFDFGILTKFYDTVSLGFAVKNLNSPDVGFKDKDIVPREYSGGFAFFLKDLGPFEDLTPALEFSYRKAENQKADIRPHIGAETWLGLHTYGLRIGGNDREMTMGLSYIKTLSNFTFQIDYSFAGSLTLQANNFGSHRVSVAWKKFAPPVFKKKIRWEVKKGRNEEPKKERPIKARRPKEVKSAGEKISSIDKCNSLKGWSLEKDGENSAELAKTAGVEKGAIQIKYKLATGHWVQLHKDFNLKISETNLIRFFVNCSGEKTLLEFKLIDKDGSNFGKKFELENSGEWEELRIPAGELSYWWGGDGQLDRQNIASIWLAVSPAQGGEGTLALDRLEMIEPKR